MQTFSVPCKMLLRVHGASSCLIAVPAQVVTATLLHFNLLGNLFLASTSITAKVLRHLT